MNKNLMRIMAIGCMVFLLTGCSSAVDGFSKRFEAGKYTEAAELYEKSIKDNVEGEKALEDYLWPIAKESLEGYKVNPDYENSNEKRLLENMATYKTEHTTDLELVLEEYDQYKMSRKHYVEAKEKIDAGEYEDAIKLFEQVLGEDTVYTDVESLTKESYVKWEAKIFEEINSLLDQGHFAQALPILTEHENWLTEKADYKTALQKANKLKKEDDEKQAKEAEEARLAAEAAEARLVAEEKRLASSLTKMRTNKDEVEGITWYYDQSTPQYTDVNNIHLYIGEKANNDVWLRLCIQYTSDSWLFIESFKFKVDEENYTITPSGYRDVERDNGGGSIWEWYDTSPSDHQLKIIKEIISSDKTIIRYEGGQYYDDRLITSGEKTALQNVLDAYEYLTR